LPLAWDLEQGSMHSCSAASKMTFIYRRSGEPPNPGRKFESA
jgi:hypothetical protein